MLWLRQISLTGRLASAYFRIATICVSVNFDWRMRTSWLREIIVLTSPLKTTTSENWSTLPTSVVSHERSETHEVVEAFGATDLTGPP